GALVVRKLTKIVFKELDGETSESCTFSFAIWSRLLFDRGALRALQRRPTISEIHETCRSGSTPLSVLLARRNARTLSARISEGRGLGLFRSAPCHIFSHSDIYGCGVHSWISPSS